MNTLPRINFTHTGTFCADLDNMVDFYCRKLGFIVVYNRFIETSLGASPALMSSWLQWAAGPTR